MTMTKKHFIAVAKIIRETDMSKHTKGELTARFIEWFYTQNTDFRESSFYNAVYEDVPYDERGQ